MFAGKPIIGLAGGIASGKSFIASLFAERGCLVIDSDRLARQAYDEPKVRETLKQWWGEGVIGKDGSINRSFIASKVFEQPTELRRLEGLIHPIIDAARRRVMSAAAHDPRIVAFVWDAPLLFEASLNLQCDAVVFVEAPLAMRLGRVKSRNWDESELQRRENSQWPLDKKRQISDYVIRNTADVSQARVQVKDVFSRIMSKAALRG